MLGGIPWNCYFQRVLSCKSPGQAQSMSILSGLLTIAFVIPPLLIGMAALGYPWSAELAARLREHPSETLPLMLRATRDHGTLWFGALERITKARPAPEGAKPKARREAWLKWGKEKGLI